MVDFDKLDKVIHERGRLGIMTLLATRPSWSFQDLKAELGLSDGNLITHLRMTGTMNPDTATRMATCPASHPQS